MTSAKSTWIDDLRNNARMQFETLEYPNFRYGLTIRMDYSDLKTEHLEKLKDQSNIEFKNTDGIHILPLKKALHSHNNILQQHLTKLMPEQHKFAQLHRMLFECMVIHVPKNKTLGKPLIINRNGGIHHLFIIAESPITIIETRESCNSKNKSRSLQSLVSNATEIIVKNNATVNFISIQKYDNSTFHFDYKNALTEPNTAMNWIDFCLGSAFTHSTIASTLQGQGSSSDIKTIFFGDKEQRFDVGAHIIHAAPHTHGNIATKGVLNDKSKNIYRGLIKIKQNAPSSMGYQKEDVLMLSKDAEADSIPQLEIDNNDVKCSHAATTTHVDDERLFYLMARGLNKKSATKMFVQGFLNPFIEQITDEKIVEEIKEHIAERLE